MNIHCFFGERVVTNKKYHVIDRCSTEVLHISGLDGIGIGYLQVGRVIEHLTVLIICKYAYLGTLSISKTLNNVGGAQLPP